MNDCYTCSLSATKQQFASESSLVGGRSIGWSGVGLRVAGWLAASPLSSTYPFLLFLLLFLAIIIIITVHLPQPRRRRRRRLRRSWCSLAAGGDHDDDDDDHYHH